MKVTWTKEQPGSCTTEVIAVPFGRKRPNDAYAKLDKASRGAIAELVTAERFKGERDRVVGWTGRLKRRPVRVLVVGVGSRRPGPREWRGAVARAAEVATRHRARSMTFFVDSADPERRRLEVGWSVEALALAAYRFDRHRTRRPKTTPPGVGRVGAVDSDDASELRAAVRAARARAEAVCLCRDLVNEPANTLGPAELAERAKEVAAARGLEARVLSADELAKRGMRLHLAVAEASPRPARFVHLIYRPRDGARSRVALVGKGVTFDSGGLNLKPGKSMTEMKTDMAGAAVVLGVMSALPRLGARVEVHGLIPIAENAVGSAGYRPGDVYRGAAGPSVEIVNTDAEGRLLADALSYAVELEPDRIVEHSTLTGACVVALGGQRAGLLTDFDTLADEYLAAAERTGELFWRLPMAPELERDLKSEVADVKHVGGRHGGAITAALFLKRFAGGLPFVHLDIAGPARADSASALSRRGGTGFGVLTCLDYLTEI